MVFQCAESTLVSPVQGLQHAFLIATRKGDLDKMKDLIGQGCSVNTTLNQVKFRPASSSQMAAYIIMNVLILWMTCYMGRNIGRELNWQLGSLTRQHQTFNCLICRL